MGYVPLFCVKEYRSSKGFTLIELMIVISIVAVLISLAAPVYSGYRIRAKVTECIHGATAAKLAISEYRQTFGHWPPDLEVTGAANTGNSRYCNPIDAYQKATGAFTIDVNEPAVNLELVKISPQLTPALSSNNAIKWNCTAAETQLEEIVYLPASCREN